MQTCNQEFYTVADLSDRWEMSADWVRHAVATGELAGTWFGGRLRVAREAVESYEATHTRRARGTAQPKPEPNDSNPPQPTPDCDGRGYPVGRSEDKCGFCGGTGHVLRDHK